MGLRYLELKGTVSPLISIDEYSPKSGSDEEVIVVAFFCNDELPAKDLDDFIDKSTIKFLDSEVSENPDENGYWLVFVEFKRIPAFWLHFYKLVKDIENVTDKLKWEVQVYKTSDLFDLHDKQLHNLVPTTEETYRALREDDRVYDYFTESCLLGFHKQNKELIFEGQFGKVNATLVDFGPAKRVLEVEELSEAVITHTTSARSTALKSVLGPGWSVDHLGDYLLVQKVETSNVAILR